MTYQDKLDTVKHMLAEVLLSDYKDKTETGHGLPDWTAPHILVQHALGERRGAGGGDGSLAYRLGRESAIGERRMKRGENMYGFIKKTVVPFPRLG